MSVDMDWDEAIGRAHIADQREVKRAEAYLALLGAWVSNLNRWFRQ